MLKKKTNTKSKQKKQPKNNRLISYTSKYGKEIIKQVLLEAIFRYVKEKCLGSSQRGFTNGQAPKLKTTTSNREDTL